MGQVALVSFGRAKFESFWTGSYLSWTRPPDGAVHNRPSRFFFFVPECPSMPFYNVIETATKLVTDNVSQFITSVNYILYVL